MPPYVLMRFYINGKYSYFADGIPILHGVSYGNKVKLLIMNFVINYRVTGAKGSLSPAKHSGTFNWDIEGIANWKIYVKEIIL